jgi:hypothetical protein
VARTALRNIPIRCWGIARLLSGGWARTPAVAYAPSVRVSTIAKHTTAGRGTSFARVLGAEIRRRRVAMGLSQDSVGRPLSRAFLSSVESGRSVPSLPSLLMIARRLNSTGASILESVETELEGRNADGHTNQATISRRG